MAECAFVPSKYSGIDPSYFVYLLMFSKVTSPGDTPHRSRGLAHPIKSGTKWVSDLGQNLHILNLIFFCLVLLLSREPLAYINL